MSKDRATFVYANDLLLEWEQCFQEGLDVSSLREEVDAFCSLPAEERTPERANALGAKLTHAALRPDVLDAEPSDYPSIQAACPQRRHSGWVPPAGEALREKIRGAWLGRIAGCLLGKPVEGWHSERLLSLLRQTGNYPLHRYIRLADFTPALIEAFQPDPNGCWADRIHGCAPWDDDTNYTVLALRLLEQFGSSFTSEDVLDCWLHWLPILSTYTAERAAYRNAIACLPPPQTALYHNPYREMIGAQIRGDFFGYIHPGQPGQAAQMAFRDACVSHVKNGIYGEMWVSAMLSAAACSNGILPAIEAGLDEIPQHSRLRRDIEEVISWYQKGDSAETIIQNIHARYDEHTPFGWCFTNANAMIVAMGLLCGEGDFGRSICLAVQAAFDTDCNGATVGSVFGMWKGASAIPPEWTAPFGGKLATSLPGDSLVSVERLTDRTMALIQH